MATKPTTPGHYRRRLARILGPGLITGAADDDPSGVATYSQVGAQFGYGLAWTLLLSYPLMVGIQQVSARIGRVTGRGIAGNLHRHYPGWLALVLIGLLSIANVINLGADLGAMGAALRLLLRGPALLYVVLFGLLSVLLMVFSDYRRYVAILRWLCLALLSYVVCAFVVPVSWSAVALALVWPPLSRHSDYIMAIVAVFGTTISPYLFFWQAQQEVEESEQDVAARPLLHAPHHAPAEFARIHIDTTIGMAVSNLIALCIVVTTAATLHVHGVTTIESAAQAAEALRAVAGRLTFAVFALGIIGTGLLTLPVLAASAAYSVGELLAWRVGLGNKLRRARAFYAAIAVATLLGGALNFIHVNPIRALYWSAVLNGVVAVPVMIAMMHLAARREVMGTLTVPRALRWLGWLSTGVMTLTVLAMAVSWLV